jgi:hypothetical protein
MPVSPRSEQGKNPTPEAAARLLEQIGWQRSESDGDWVLANDPGQVIRFDEGGWYHLLDGVGGRAGETTKELEVFLGGEFFKAFSERRRQAEAARAAAEEAARAAESALVTESTE